MNQEEKSCIRMPTSSFLFCCLLQGSMMLRLMDPKLAPKHDASFPHHNTFFTYLCYVSNLFLFSAALVVHFVYILLLKTY